MYASCVHLVLVGWGGASICELRGVLQVEHCCLLRAHMLCGDVVIAAVSGDLWVWGRDFNGSLGLGNPTNASVLVTGMAHVLLNSAVLVCDGVQSQLTLCCRCVG